MITVIDSVMGTGKTSYAIQMMDNIPKEETSFLFVTPYLEEATRIKNTVKHREFKTPLGANEQRGKRISKIEQLKTFLAEGSDVAITHELFKSFDEEVFDILRQGGYTLILDEVMNVVSNIPLEPGDIKFLLRHDIISIDEHTKQVSWLDRDYCFDNKDDFYDEDDTKKKARFIDIKRYADSGNLYAYRDQFMIWQLPVRLFEHFDETFILTYLFEGQLQSYYYKLHGLKYKLKSVVRDSIGLKLVDYSHELDVLRRKEFIPLMHIYEGKLNAIGDKRTALGTNNVKRMKKEDKERVKKNLYTYLRNTVKAKQDEVIWTTKKVNRELFAPRGFKDESCFVSHNVRATNDYKDRRVCAYVYNRFMQPHENAFFQEQGLKVDEDLLALSDLLQWIWRSRIREGQPIEIYIPSKRMRTLLYKWLDGEL